MTPESAAVFFDVDGTIREAARVYAALPPEANARHRAAVERARFDAARLLVANGSAEDRALAARHLFGVPRRSA